MPDPPIVVVAHAANAHSGNAEGVAGSSAIRELARRMPVAAVVGPAGYLAVTPASEPAVAVQQVAVAEPTGNWLVRGMQRPKWHPTGLVARGINMLWQINGYPTLRMGAWADAAATAVLGVLDQHPGAVVWARALPPQSFTAAIRAWRRQRFPLVAHFNDPTPHCLLWGSRSTGRRSDDPLHWRQNRWLRDHADAFTFPSRRLLDLMVAAVGFDPSRCFVIPHTPAAPVGTVAPAALRTGNGGDTRPRILYAGTFYGSAFSAALREGLAAATQPAGGPQFVLALKNASRDQLDWLRANLRDVELALDCTASEVGRLAATCHAALVAQARFHAPLLLTKLADAVGAGLPVLAVASDDSTTADIVRRIGGQVVDPGSTAAEFASAVTTFTQALQQQPGDVRNSGPASDSSSVRDRFSGARIAADLAAVADFARRRHRGGLSATPPALDRWP